MLASLLKLFIVGIVALVGIGVALALVGAMVGLAFTLVFKVAPLLLVGYLILRFVVPKPKQISSADRQWLEE
jgi:hypothetical protein